jgi:hypothetical protein
LRATQRQSPRRGQSSPAHPWPAETRPPARAALLETGAAASLSSERRELVCSLIGLTVKLGLVAVAGTSVVRLATAYRERMDRQGELTAVLQLEEIKLARSRERFDGLFTVDGEQRLIREQNQWIAPDRLRVVWQQPAASPDPEAN